MVSTERNNLCTRAEFHATICIHICKISLLQNECCRPYIYVEPSPLSVALVQTLHENGCKKATSSWRLVVSRAFRCHEVGEQNSPYPRYHRQCALEITNTIFNSERQKVRIHNTNRNINQFSWAQRFTVADSLQPRPLERWVLNITQPHLVVVLVVLLHI